MRRKLLGLSLTLMLAPGTIAWAAEGRIPLLTLPGPPYIITQPGHYILTRDITHSANSVVQIRTDGVTLDLGGHTITGPTSFVAPTIAVLLSSSSTRGIIIRNGRIVSGSQGVSGGGTSARIRLEGIEITQSLGGISVSADHAEVIDCHIHDLATLGGVGGGAIGITAPGGRVVGNLIQNIPSFGISIEGFHAGEIRRNVVRNFGSTIAAACGICLDDPSAGGTAGALVADNTVSGLPGGTDDEGIRVVGRSNFLVGNVVTNNGGDGIFINGWYNRLERNVTNGNGGHGIGFALIARGIHLVANQSQSNGECGLHLSATVATLLRDNTLSDNTGGNICGTPGTDAGGNYCDAALCP